MRIIKYFPYRTGRVVGLILPRETQKLLEVELHKLNQSEIDNHVCFSILGEYGTQGETEEETPELVTLEESALADVE